MKTSHIITLVSLGVLILVLGTITAIIYSSHKSDQLNEAKQTLGVDNGSIYTDLDGNKIELANFLDQVLIVNIWASWSPFSAQELPLLEKIAETYRDKNLVVLAINRKEEVPQVMRYIKTLPDLPNIIFVIDKTDHFYKASGGYAMPETIIYNKQGTMVFHGRGTINEDDFISKIESLLN